MELIRALAVYAEPPGEHHPRLAAALGLATPTGADHTETFLFELHPYASVHLGHDGMLGGESRDRAAGFWRAVGRTPPKEPDHLSALLGLYVALLEERAELPAAEAALVDAAAAALLWEHLAGWVFELAAHLAATAGPYGPWARLLGGTLEAEARAGRPPEALPLPLADAPALPDPRTDGGEAFLAGMTAPIRTGFILGRSTLAGIGRALDLGVRAGERRYVLEHLLGQAPGPVLAALAELAAAAADRHAGRRSWLGSVAAFGEARARRTATLLRALSDQGADMLSPHPATST